MLAIWFIVFSFIFVYLLFSFRCVYIHSEGTLYQLNNRLYFDIYSIYKSLILLAILNDFTFIFTVGDTESRAVIPPDVDCADIVNAHNDSECSSRRSMKIIHPYQFNHSALGIGSAETLHNLLTRKSVHWQPPLIPDTPFL
nr:MAG TPA: hypothetical protein [Caudoviricetes sp.]